MKPGKEASKRLSYSPFEDIRERVSAGEARRKTEQRVVPGRMEERNEEDELFFQAMADVVPLDEDGEAGIEPAKDLSLIHI